MQIKLTIKLHNFTWYTYTFLFLCLSSPTWHKQHNGRCVYGACCCPTECATYMLRLRCRQFTNLQHVCCKCVLRAVTCHWPVLCNVFYETWPLSVPLTKLSRNSKEIFDSVMRLYWNPIRPVDSCHFIYPQHNNYVWISLVSVGGEM
jgi:hypothetical protein